MLNVTEILHQLLREGYNVRFNKSFFDTSMEVCLMRGGQFYVRSLPELSDEALIYTLTNMLEEFDLKFSFEIGS